MFLFVVAVSLFASPLGQMTFRSASDTACVVAANTAAADATNALSVSIADPETKGFSMMQTRFNMLKDESGSGLARTSGFVGTFVDTSLGTPVDSSHDSRSFVINVQEPYKKGWNNATSMDNISEAHANLSVSSLPSNVSATEAHTNLSVSSLPSNVSATEETMTKSTVSASALDCRKQPRLKGLNLPVFCSPADLHASPEWLRYLRALYGQTVDDTSNYPIDLQNFWVFHSQLLQAAFAGSAARPTFLHGSPQRKTYNFGNKNNTGCPQHRWDVYEEIGGVHNGTGWVAYDPPGMLWIYNPPPYSPIPNQTLVEVTHYSLKDSMEVGYWMYYAPGSGVFYNLGKTKAYQTHRDAVLEHLPHRTCRDFECIEHYAELVEVASHNLTSIQFLGHHDQRCGNTAIEIIDLHSSGHNTCGPFIFGGLQGKCPCECGNGEYLKCKMWNCPSSEGGPSYVPQAFAPQTHFIANQVTTTTTKPSTNNQNWTFPPLHKMSYLITTTNPSSSPR